MKRKLLIMVFSVFISMVLIATYQYFNENNAKLEADRALTGDKFLDSKNGVTRYKIFGVDNKKTVILIHSFNGFIETWEPNIEPLVQAGYRVVLYDLFGRGFSDRPRLDNDLALFRNQLSSVIELVGADKVHLIGASFGSVIATDYATSYPNRVDSLVLIGPAGWSSENKRNPMIDFPVISDFIFQYFGKGLVKPKVEAYFLKPSKFSHVIEDWAAFASYPGTMRSALSTLRHAPVFDYATGWKKLSQLNKKPVLFIWGKQDVNFPFHNTEKLPSVIPHARLVGVDEAAHWVSIEQPKQVNNAIVSFLSTLD